MFGYFGENLKVFKNQNAQHTIIARRQRLARVFCVPESTQYCDAKQFDTTGSTPK